MTEPPSNPMIDFDWDAWDAFRAMLIEHQKHLNQEASPELLHLLEKLERGHGPKPPRRREATA